MIKSFLLLLLVTGVVCINLSYATEKSGEYNRLVHEKVLFCSSIRTIQSGGIHGVMKPLMLHEN